MILTSTPAYLRRDPQSPVVDLDWDVIQPYAVLKDVCHGSCRPLKYLRDGYKACSRLPGQDFPARQGKSEHQQQCDPPITMNVLTERWVGWPPRSYSATRGWSPAALDAAYTRLGEQGWLAGDDLTTVGLSRREELERRTDDGMQLVLEAIGPDLDAVVSACQRWSQALVTAGVVPPDPYKAAAG